MLSVFTKIAAAEHSTVAWLEKELALIEGEAPTIEKVIDTGLTYIGPVLQIALDAIDDPAAASLVGTVVTKAQADLKVVSALVTDFGPTPTAASMFASVQANLGGLLTAGQVTNAQSVAAVNKAVNEVGVLGAAVSTAAAQLKAAATPAPATPAPAAAEPVAA